jgi:exodeoxyribonuclease III
MKVMSSNTLFGGETRFAALLAIYAAERPDLLVLQEGIDWGDRELSAVAEAVGVPFDEQHTFLAEASPRPSGRRFHLGLISRVPLRSALAHNDGFGHALIEATLPLSADATLEGPEITLFGAHFVATNDDARLREVEVFAELLAQRRAAGRAAHALLVGDLNALSRHDPYPADLEDQFRAAAIRKYGEPPRFDVMDRVFSLGFVDTLGLAEGWRPSQRAGTAGAPRTTSDAGVDQPWVTARRGPSHARVDTRTDYVLVSSSMRSWVRGSGVIDVGDASDHHAIFATVEAPRDETRSG